MNEGAMAETDKHGDEDGERIAKVIARAGLASRREAEDWIAAGRVAVNGAVIHSPALNVSGRDRISIDGEPLPARERTRVFLYHKPRGALDLAQRSARPIDHFSELAQGSSPPHQRRAARLQY